MEGFKVHGATVGECINELVGLVPAPKSSLFFESRLSATVQVEVRKESINREERVTKALKGGDEIRISLKGY